VQEYSKRLSNWLQGLLDNLRNYKQRCRLPLEDIPLDTVAQQVCMLQFVCWTWVPPNLLGSEWQTSFCASCSFLGVNVQIGMMKKLAKSIAWGSMRGPQGSTHVFAKQAASHTAFSDC
jgi:hypothetical protein